MANTTFYIRQNDTAPPIEATLYDGSGALVNLAGATVKFQMTQAITGSTVAVDADADVDDVNGVVSYAWDAADTADAGTYNANFEVTFSGGAVQSFPNDRFITVVIGPDLA